MLKKSTHIILFSVFGVLLVLLIALETASILNDGFTELVTLLAFVAVAVFFIIIVAYANTKNKIFERLFNGDYATANDMIDKHYATNKSLFLEVKVAYYMMTGNKEAMQVLYQKYYKPFTFKGKSFYLQTFIYLCGYITNTENKEDLGFLIEGMEKNKAKYVFLVSILYAVQALYNQQYEDAIEKAKSVTRAFHYPAYGFIVYKVIYLANKQLGLDNTFALQKLNEFSDNSFLKEALKSLLAE